MNGVQKDMQISMSRLHNSRTGLRGKGNGVIVPGPPLQIKYSFENFLWFRSDTRVQLCIISYVTLSIRGPQQQLISLQVWLSASFRNRCWKPTSIFGFVQCKYIWFRW